MPDLFQKLHHLCLVVHDIGKSQAAYEAVGIGPWIAYPPLLEYGHDLQVPSREGFFNLRYSVCNLPNVQLQLCQPGPEDSPQRRHLDAKGEGVFHIGFEVPDADAAQASAGAVGLATLMRGRRADGTGFNYLDTADRLGVTLLTRATPPASRT